MDKKGQKQLDLAYILGPAECNTSDVGDFFQTKADESLAGLPLGTRLNFVKGRSRSGVFFVVMVVMAFVVVTFVVVTFMVRVVGGHFFDMSRHSVKVISIDSVTSRSVDA